MAEENPKETVQPELAGGTYEIIRSRLKAHADDLRARIDKLNTQRKDVFGAIETRLLTTERVVTAHNCVPRDMVMLGNSLLFGYNVQLGLKRELELGDVFSAYSGRPSDAPAAGNAEHGFHEQSLELISDRRFVNDFKNLYRYFTKTRFARFAHRGPHLHMVFRTGEDVTTIKTFKWLVGDDHSLTYVDNRSEHELSFPAQHEFEWKRATRDMHRAGRYGHISIEDRVFVETTGGDLTIKVEDNTETGAGIYAEEVDDPDQTLDDAEIYYALVGNLIFLKIRPYAEEVFRYIIFNEKVEEAIRVDALADACVLLPEDHGVIFANGYYLQTGEYKQFESDLSQMLFHRRLASTNGEDTLYAFYNRDTGTFILLSYNLISQQVATPVICHGYTLYENGEMLRFRAETEAQKYHAVQIWQTPFVGPNYIIPTKEDSYIYKLGNKDVVRCMAACRGILTLVAKDESYANIYVDIARESSGVLDAYHWLERQDTCALAEPLRGIREAATAAIDEFDKVVRIRRNTHKQVAIVVHQIHGILGHIRSSRFDKIDDFVKNLSELRAVRGATISLRDLRYVDLEEVAGLEAEVVENTEALSYRCVEFLLTDEALEPYAARVEGLRTVIDPLATVAEAKQVEKTITEAGSDLEMLIDIVSNLKIADATQRTAIIENISGIYSTLNQVRAGLKNKIQALAEVEGSAEFASQMKLLNQAVINYLDVCDTPVRVEDYLTRIMVQIGELEGTFADFDDFIVELTEKRSEIYSAFNARKLALVEALNKRTASLQRSAERILEGMATRVAQLDSVDAINGYFAADLMVEKVRDIIEQLGQLEDSVKADDIQSRLKTLHQDTLRQLKDRQELYVDGQNVIQFGPHKFAVNTQELALTTVVRDGQMLLHLTGTNFFEALADEELEACRELWDQVLPSENPEVYRAEYLAALFIEALDEGTLPGGRNAFSAADQLEQVTSVQGFMGPRYAEGYVKGVHDEDAAKIATALIGMDASVGLLATHPRARALAAVFWHAWPDREARERMRARLQGLGNAAKLFPGRGAPARVIGRLREDMATFVQSSGLLEAWLIDQAADYLYAVLTRGRGLAVGPEAAELVRGFTEQLTRRGAETELAGPLAALEADPAAAFGLIKEWLAAYQADRGQAGPNAADYRNEAAALLLTGSFDPSQVIQASVEKRLTGLIGNHARIHKGSYLLNHNEFTLRLTRFKNESVPRFMGFSERKQAVIAQARQSLRLDEFRPRVLSSFVRNRLIDRVYLPLVGDNLAKQIGVVGDQKRTDRMGLLLLISPPGYGKTTLMEYLANRLGIIFMKINGPAIGNRVSSLDPDEAPNAAAREELKKLNLSLEMGDNVMIYVDDIQHCNPEFLQKFISLCDAQRKIEGVYKDQTRTYDLRGKKVCVVMAGNPYSESGEAFRIPDMLANRADTYNLGDIIGDTRETFELSYLENALTSNPSLARMAARHFEDIYGIVRMVETGSREGIELAGNYSAEELNEYLGVMEKLIRVRDVVLAVNQAYILSAAQADEYRTEPPFLLQGSYRNMNRIAGKVLPVMNTAELETLIQTHYLSEAQTLTTGAEANILRFKQMTGQQTEAEAKRWAEIKKTFNRNQMFAGAGGSDRMAQALVQLSSMGEGLGAIQTTLATGIARLADSSKGDDTRAETIIADETLKKFAKLLSGLKSAAPPSQAPTSKHQTDTSISDETLDRFAQILKNAFPAPAPQQAPAQKAKEDPIVAQLAPETIQAISSMLSKIQAAAPATPIVLPPGASEENIQAQSADGKVKLELSRRWEGQGTGASSIFAPLRFVLTFGEKTHVIEDRNQLLYQNSHHNLADSMEARTKALRIFWWSAYSVRKAGLVHKVRAERIKGGEVVLPETILSKVEERISR